MDNKLANKGDFYFGLGAALFCSVVFASFGTLTRYMKDMHWTVMQFNYGLLGTFMFLAYLIIEYMIYQFSDSMDYKHDKLRILTYDSYQWG